MHEVLRVLAAVASGQPHTRPTTTASATPPAAEPAALALTAHAHAPDAPHHAKRCASTDPCDGDVIRHHEKAGIYTSPLPPRPPARPTSVSQPGPQAQPVQPPAAPAMAGGELDSVVALQDSLHTQFSALCPAVFPKQFRRFQDARALAVTDAGRAAADAVLRKEAARAKTALGLERVVALVEARINFASMRFEVQGIRFVAAEDAAAANLEHVMHANQADLSRAKVLAERFVAANQLRSSSSASSSSFPSHDAPAGLSPQALAHEAYNTAYTLKVLASNMRLRPVAVVEATNTGGDDDGGDSARPERHTLPLPDGADVAAVVRALCAQGRRRGSAASHRR